MALLVVPHQPADRAQRQECDPGHQIVQCCLTHHVTLHRVRVTAGVLTSYPPASIMIIYMKSKKQPMTVTEMSRLGAKARNKALSREERVRLAKKAIAARWSKYRAEKEQR